MQTRPCFRECGNQTASAKRKVEGGTSDSPAFDPSMLSYPNTCLTASATVCGYRCR